MVAKRIIPCLDVKDGRTVKGVHFVDLKDAGDPVALAYSYSSQGADELVFLDISATEEKRKTLIEMVKAVARQISIPFTIGGGIKEVADAYELLSAGADKISINSAAFTRPQLIEELAKQFGSQFVVVAVDTKKVGDRNRVHWMGGKIPTEIDTETWVLELEQRGAGEVLLTSMDHDGTQTGFDLALIGDLNQRLRVPLIASGGAGNKDHFFDLFEQTGVDAALAASIFHFGTVSIPSLKSYLIERHIPIRPVHYA